MRANRTAKGKPMGNSRKRKHGKQRRGNKRPRIGDLTLSFGRYLGRPIAKVPRRYLEWCVSAVARIPETDRWAIKKFLRLDSAENVEVIEC